jgi:hypothetical protein
LFHLLTGEKGTKFEKCFLFYVSDRYLASIRPRDKDSHIKFIKIERKVYDSAQPALVIWFLPWLSIGRLWKDEADGISGVREWGVFLLALVGNGDIERGRHETRVSLREDLGGGSETSWSNAVEESDDEEVREGEHHRVGKPSRHEGYHQPNFTADASPNFNENPQTSLDSPHLHNNGLNTRGDNLDSPENSNAAGGGPSFTLPNPFNIDTLREALQKNRSMPPALRPSLTMEADTRRFQSIEAHRAPASSAGVSPSPPTLEAAQSRNSDHPLPSLPGLPVHNAAPHSEPPKTH